MLCRSTDVLRLITGAAVTVDVAVDFADFDGTTPPGVVTPDRQLTAITTATTTTIMAAPSSPKLRKPKVISIKNKHASSAVFVEVEQFDGSTAYKVYDAMLLAGEEILYSDPGNWTIKDASGASKPGGTLDPSTNEFRLTGVSGQPVMLADSTTLANLYLARFKGGNICLFNGTVWNRYAPVEPTVAVTGRTTDLPFDVFAYADAAGVVQLEMLNWTNATTRATALVRQDGVWVKTGDATRRYVGSVRARSATTFHHVVNGVDLPVKFDLYNADNRVEFAWQLRSLTNTWAYTIATWRQCQGSVNYQIDVMNGLEEEHMNADLLVSSRNATISIPRQVGIGYDSTTAFTGVTSATANTVASIESDQNARIGHKPTIGRHFYAWLEISTATGTCTWVGDDGALRLQSGMSGTWSC